jgi:trehalose 2-sulfotransferase
MTIVRERAQWEAFFARTGIRPLRITYERFLEDRSTHVDLIAHIVDVQNPAVDPRKIDLAVQRDAVTEEWAQRFRAENGDPATCWIACFQACRRSSGRFVSVFGLCRGAM